MAHNGFIFVLLFFFFGSTITEPKQRKQLNVLAYQAIKISFDFGDYINANNVLSFSKFIIIGLGNIRAQLLMSQIFRSCWVSFMAVDKHELNQCLHWQPSNARR